MTFASNPDQTWSIFSDLAGKTINPFAVAMLACLLDTWLPVGVATATGPPTGTLTWTRTYSGLGSSLRGVLEDTWARILPGRMLVIPDNVVTFQN